MSAKCCCKLTKKNVLKRLPFNRQPLFDLGNLFVLFLLLFWFVALAERFAGVFGNVALLKVSIH